MLCCSSGAVTDRSRTIVPRCRHAMKSTTEKALPVTKGLHAAVKDTCTMLDGFQRRASCWFLVAGVAKRRVFEFPETHISAVYTSPKAGAERLPYRYFPINAGATHSCRRSRPICVVDYMMIRTMPSNYVIDDSYHGDGGLWVELRCVSFLKCIFYYWTGI